MGTLNKNISLYLAFVLVAKDNASTLSLTEINTGRGKRFDLIPLNNILYLALGWKEHRRSRGAGD